MDTPSPARAPRMNPLAVLPVFMTLTGERAVLAGGAEAAAWKAELVAASGAALEVFAAEPCEEMEALEAEGRLTITRRQWQPEDLKGARLAVCDAGDEAEAAAFRDAALAAGTAWNVIDKPEFCGFQFGSIVNRSPLVIAISTAGAAPILGQNLRRRIETLVPQALAGWAGLASRVRARVLEALSPGAERRRFWERFSDLAFSGRPQDEAAVGPLIAEAKGDGSGIGRVILVGAGPGDAEHLTIKALRALQAADVILADDLVSPEVLELARREAQRIMVGKRGGRASWAQGDINALMLQHAREGRTVVRVKSGDPSVFGRAGEELAALSAAGIAVEIVPGVTAALALAARLGVSLTDKTRAPSLRFISGHGPDGRLPEVDWKACAEERATLVIYMAGCTAREAATRLMEAGLNPETPAVAARALTTAEESITRLTLAQLEAEGIPGDDGPVLLGIGACFAA
ncbi:siroheme synthase [Agaricicola taiwanensis]|uniref:Siroheme synthase n=1 Tax=Agaricicola taiwanensis TaxID=591372 RepID=A0A8J2YNA4_9RHOB|nr:siroheme synthase CysG [Agaricicola taiwanensis]GGE54992.1 siroheme synthase [Agaricicola taiwanensis]